MIDLPNEKKKDKQKKYVYINNTRRNIEISAKTSGNHVNYSTSLCSSLEMLIW